MLYMDCVFALTLAGLTAKCQQISTNVAFTIFIIFLPFDDSVIVISECPLALDNALCFNKNLHNTKI